MGATAPPAVREAVVDARAVGDDKRLVAWVVPAADVAEETLAGALRQHVSAALPDYMVPAAWVVVAALPLSPNGKLDRRALPASVRALLRVEPAAAREGGNQRPRAWFDQICGVQETSCDAPSAVPGTRR